MIIKIGPPWVYVSIVNSPKSNSLITQSETSIERVNKRKPITLIVQRTTRSWFLYRFSMRVPKLNCFVFVLTVRKHPAHKNKTIFLVVWLDLGRPAAAVSSLNTPYVEVCDTLRRIKKAEYYVLHVGKLVYFCIIWPILHTRRVQK